MSILEQISLVQINWNFFSVSILSGRSLWASVIYIFCHFLWLLLKVCIIIRTWLALLVRDHLFHSRVLTKYCIFICWAAAVTPLLAATVSSLVHSADGKFPAKEMQPPSLMAFCTFFMTITENYLYRITKIWKKSPKWPISICTRFLKETDFIRFSKEDLQLSLNSLTLINSYI